jgi:MFS family permease
MAFVAIPLLAARSTGDPRLVAGVAVASRLPWLIVGLPAGALADRLPRARTLAAVEGTRAVLLALVAVAALAHRTPVGALFALAFTLGSFGALYSGLTFGGLPEIVEPEALGTANSRLYTVESAGEFFIGPALGGVLFALARPLPFVLDAASFAGSGALLAVAFRRLPGPAGLSQSSVRRDIAAGWRCLIDTPLVRTITTVTVSYAFFQTVATATIVLYCLHRLHTGVAGYGVFIALGSVGDIVGGLLGGRVSDRCSTSTIIVGAGTAAAVGYLVVGLAPNLAVGAAGMALEAAAVGVFSVASITARQRVVPTEFLGRVGNTMRMFICGSATAGLLVGGLITARLGPVAPLLIAGVGELAAVSLIAWHLRHRSRCSAVLPPMLPVATGPTSPSSDEASSTSDRMKSCPTGSPALPDGPASTRPPRQLIRLRRLRAVWVLSRRRQGGRPSALV